MFEKRLFILLVCYLTSGTFGQLYRFSSHTFTTAGASGRFGPTLAQVQASYAPAWAKNTNFLYMPTQGYQFWVVPATGKYRIKAAGAAGGEIFVLQ